MAKKMALVPPELVSEYYQLNKPEIRLEDNILSLLQQNEIPDDMRAKLLSQLITKYQKAMQPPPPKKAFEIPPELLESLSTMPTTETTIRPEDIPAHNVLTKYLGYTVPKALKKYISPILEKLKNANYVFNDKGELEINGKPEYRSNAIDLFNYIMRDTKRIEPPPKGFDKFFKAIYDVNIPRQWIGNKRLRDQLSISEMNPLFSEESPASPVKQEASVFSSDEKKPTPWLTWSE